MNFNNTTATQQKISPTTMNGIRQPGDPVFGYSNVKPNHTYNDFQTLKQEGEEMAGSEPNACCWNRNCHEWYCPK